MRKEPDAHADDLPLQQFLTFRLSRVQAKLNAQASRVLEKTAGLTLTQWRILAFLGSGAGSTSAELTRVAALDKGQVSRKLKSLIEEGLVTARADAADSRVQRLSLSRRGRALYEQTLPTMRARQRALQSEMSPAEVQRLFATLDKLEAAAEMTEFER